MTKPLVTASSAHRFLACPSFAALPHEEQPTSEAASRGTEVHEFLDGTKSKSQLSVAAQLIAERFNRAKWRSEYETREHAYGWSPLTGEFFKFGRLPGPRMYPDIGQPYMAGTVDGIADLLGLPIVDDIKTGKEREYYKVQLKLLLFMASEGSGGTCRITYAGSRPRWTVTKAEMDEFREQLISAYKEYLFSKELVAIGKNPVTTRGAHCQWCPAKKSCTEFGGTIEKKEGKK